MSPLLQKLRHFLQKFFFWHGEGTHSHEFAPEPGHDHALVLNVTEKPSMPGWRQLRYAGRVLSTRERRVLLAMVALLVCGLGVSGWLVMRGHIEIVPAPGGRMIEAVIGAPKYPHPFYAGSNDPDRDLVALVYAGLFRRAAGTDPVPDLAERYAWSDDGKKLTVTLRDDARFHDGTPVTADDVVFTLTAAKDPVWRGPFVSALRNVTIERTDDKTINLALDHADASLLDTLTLGILPQHIWQDVPPSSAHLADANIKPVGAGPFRVRSFTKDGRGAIVAYTLERNDQYHGIKPYLQQMELRFFPDQPTAEDALKNGRVDALAFVPGPATEALVQHDRLQSSTIELPQETIAFFNLNDPLLKDVKIRQALSLAVERDDIVTAQADIASPVTGPFPFTEPATATTTPEARLDQARSLLNAAGWVVPAEGDVRIRKGSATSTASASSTTPVTLTITITVPDVPDLAAVADALRRRWSLLGAHVDVRTEDVDMLARRITTDRNAQILIWNVLLSPSQDQRPLWWSGEAKNRGLNLSNLTDRNVDDALDAMSAATTTATLAQTRDAFTQTLLARAPAVFLTRPGYGYVHVPRLQGLAEVLQLGTTSDRFSDIADWYVKTAWKWQ